MTPSMPRLLMVDPLSLIGREILLLLERDEVHIAHISYRHTDDDPEHQIAELAGNPALVPPLEGPDDFTDCDAVLVAAETDSPRLDHVAEFLRSNPGTPVVVVGRPGRLRSLTTPAAGPAAHWPSLHLRVAHPALVATSVLVAALADLEPAGGGVAAVDPVSSLGRDAVERLAQQASRRLSGTPVEEEIEGAILAFNLIATDDTDLDEDAALLLPGLDLAVTRSMSGHFHGHVAHIALAFARSLDELEVRDALLSDARIIHSDSPLRLDGTPDSDEVVILPPRLSRERKHLAVTAMVDGLRVGGARTALDILASLVGS